MTAPVAPAAEPPVERQPVPDGSRPGLGIEFDRAGAERFRA
jgi:hypothetical protein